MKTTIIPALPHTPQEELSTTLAEPVRCLLSGTPVAIPTETVYGLSANALDSLAVDKIFQIKGRPSDNPLIVHISSLSMLPQLLDAHYTSTKQYTTEDIYALIPKIYHTVIEKLWPGPLTLLFPTTSRVPHTVTAGHSTVAIRFPKHPIALRFIELCGVPLAAPSANTSGRPSPTLAQHVMDDLKGLIPYIIDGGRCDSGVESTVLDGLSTLPCILRPGGVSYEDLMGLNGMGGLRVYKKDFVSESMEQAPTTPGMKYKHYTPDADVYVFEETIVYGDVMMRKVELLTRADERVGVMGSLRFTSYIQQLLGEERVCCFVYEDRVEFAQELFKGLRALEHNQKIILVEGIAEEREGMAVMNRLRKAATELIFTR